MGGIHSNLFFLENIWTQYFMEPAGRTWLVQESPHQSSHW